MAGDDLVDLGNGRRVQTRRRLGVETDQNLFGSAAHHHLLGLRFGEVVGRILLIGQSEPADQPRQGAALEQQSSR